MERKNKDIAAPYTPREELSLGGMVRCAGNAEEYITGGWRSQKPIIDWDKCKQCLLCWPVCPDMAILVEDEKRKDFDYDHCKGCGVCVKVCPFGALAMTQEEN